MCGDIGNVILIYNFVFFFLVVGDLSILYRMVKNDIRLKLKVKGN